MRSRCDGSMLAWTLNTKAENGLSSARGASSRSSRGDGDGASSMTASSSSRTPKLVSADPTNTGVDWPARNDGRSTSAPIASSSEHSSSAAFHAVPCSALPCRAGDVDVAGLLGCRRRAARRAGEPGVPPGAAIDQSLELLAVADRPRDRRRAQLDLLLDLVEQLERLAAGPVVLVEERDHRQVADRQTWNSFSVCASMPFAASSTITTASTAASTRYVSSEKSRWPGVSSRFMM